MSDYLHYDRIVRHLEDKHNIRVEECRVELNSATDIYHIVISTTDQTVSLRIPHAKYKEDKEAVLNLIKQEFKR